MNFPSATSRAAHSVLAWRCIIFESLRPTLPATPCESIIYPLEGRNNYSRGFPPPRVYKIVSTSFVVVTAPFANEWPVCRQPAVRAAGRERCVSRLVSASRMVEGILGDNRIGWRPTHPTDTPNPYVADLMRRIGLESTATAAVEAQEGTSWEPRAGSSTYWGPAEEGDPRKYFRSTERWRNPADAKLRNAWEPHRPCLVLHLS